MLAFDPLRYLVAAAIAFAVPAGIAASDYAEQRQDMVALIARNMEAQSPHTAEAGSRSLSNEVRAAMATVPRHRFVPEERRNRAYDNRPLPIGYGQTISQPYIVALMTQLLALEPSDRVLEIGTGSGYQAAVAAEIADAVYSIEIVPELAERAEQALTAAEINNVSVRNADGYHGWPAHAPFDAIIVTAAVDHVPPPLLKQLGTDGRLILPLGDPFASQVLTLVSKDEEGGVTSEQILPVRFVPLTRSEGD